MNIRTSNREMIKTARACGASAAFTGSGGAIIGTVDGASSAHQTGERTPQVDAKVIQPVSRKGESRTMVKKAVIPAAGFGTRFLPVTKAQPKEMLPVVDTPAIQYVVQEAVDSGIDDILIISGKGKRAIEDHFDRNLELENHLESREEEDAR